MNPCELTTSQTCVYCMLWLHHCERGLLVLVSSKVYWLLLPSTSPSSPCVAVSQRCQCPLTASPRSPTPSRSPSRSCRTGARRLPACPGRAAEPGRTWPSASSPPSGPPCCWASAPSASSTSPLSWPPTVLALSHAHILYTHTHTPHNAATHDWMDGWHATYWSETAGLSSDYTSFMCTFFLQLLMSSCLCLLFCFRFLCFIFSLPAPWNLYFD